MTEPFLVGTASALWLAGADDLARAMSKIQTDALLGACAGAAVFALRESPTTGIKRALQFLVSILIGYLAAAEIDRLLPIHERSVCAFIGATLAVTVMNMALDTFAHGDLFALWRRFRRARDD